MSIGDLPHISAGTYASSAVGLDQPFRLFGEAPAIGVAILQTAVTRRIASSPAPAAPINSPNLLASIGKPKENPMPGRRLVQVFIADPNDNVPLADSLLFSGKQQLTDATDQELFFEIDINSILKAHNDKRVKIVDKQGKERTEYLEAAKIRDLRMVVVTIAQF